MHEREDRTSHVVFVHGSAIQLVSSAFALQSYSQVMRDSLRFKEVEFFTPTVDRK